MPSTNVVITGMGVVSPIGLGRDAFWQALESRSSGIRSLAERIDGGAAPGGVTEPPGLWIGAPIVDFDPKQYVRPRKALKVMCREIQTAFAASQMAIEDAGLAESLSGGADQTVSPSAIGTVFGSEMLYGPPTEMLDSIQACVRSDGSVDASHFGTAAMRGIMPLWMLKYLPNMPACHVGISAGAQGPNNSIILGDVSGPAALVEAASCVDRGVADYMISGATGTRINTTRLNYSGDYPIPEPADPIANSSRPHDPNASGVVGGEAAAAVLLESSASAERRGARPLAEIVASASRFVPSPAMRQGVRSARRDVSPPRGSAEAIVGAIEAVLRQSDAAPSDVGAVIGHGMGDRQMDGAERQAIRRLVPSVPLVAPIASAGHTGAASGMLELATAVSSLVHQVVPPTLHAEAAEDSAGLLSQSRPLAGKYALAITHTSEGNAYAVLLARYGDR